MASLTQKVGKNQVSDVEIEMRELKEAQSTSFRKALGYVSPGRSVPVPEKADKSTLGVIIRGIPEEKGKPIDRMTTDFAQVDGILEDRKLTKAARLGKYDPVRKKNCPLLVTTASDISKNLILKSALNLKHFSFDDAPVFISPELNSEDTKKHNGCLKTRHEILDNLSNSLTAKDVRIRNLSLDLLENSTWTPLDKSRYSNSSETDQQGQE